MDKSQVIADVCVALSAGAKETAIDVLAENYPFSPVQITKRRYGPIEATGVFVRDGFIDRYSGDRLVFPQVFRVLSLVLESKFPYHPNWKTDLTHPAYWELGATIDHRVPVTFGGEDETENWITTSMLRNYAKMNYSIEQLGWTVHPRGDIRVWDGLIQWFVDYTAQHKETLLTSASVMRWRNAAVLALEAARK